MEKPAPIDARVFSLDVIRRLRAKGFVALWAGGCVRDWLLGREPKDYDVATNAVPDVVCKLFRRSLAIGASFGVIRVMGPGDVGVEVATFRADGPYSDGRHPDRVVFSNAEEDAQRRDFTINGMFYDPIEERCLDFVDGERDLRAGVIRAIGDPRARFAEDKLRMLRAVRFASRFGFAIEAGTREAIAAMAAELDVVSVERVFVELRQMLAATSRVAALRQLKDVGLLAVALPEVVAAMEGPDAWDFTLRVLEAWPMEASAPLAFAGLLAAVPDGVASSLAFELFRRLKASNDERDRLVWLVQHRRGFDGAPTARPAKLKRLLASAGADELLDYHEALERARMGRADDNAWVRQWNATLPEFDRDPPPLVTGDDLIAEGFRPGRHFKTWLDRVRDEQLDGAIHSKEEGLALVRGWATSPAP